MKTTLERIQELRETGMGLHDAKRLVAKQDLDIEIRDAKTLEDMRAILWSLNARVR